MISMQFSHASRSHSGCASSSIVDHNKVAIWAERHIVRVMVHGLDVSATIDHVIVAVASSDAGFFNEIASMSHRGSFWAQDIWSLVRMHNVVDHLQISHSDGRAVFIPLTSMSCTLAPLIRIQFSLRSHPWYVKVLNGCNYVGWSYLPVQIWIRCLTSRIILVCKKWCSLDLKELIARVYTRHQKFCNRRMLCAWSIRTVTLPFKLGWFLTRLIELLNLSGLIIGCVQHPFLQQGALIVSWSSLLLSISRRGSRHVGTATGLIVISSTSFLASLTSRSLYQFFLVVKLEGVNEGAINSCLRK